MLRWHPLVDCVATKYSSPPLYSEPSCSMCPPRECRREQGESPPVRRTTDRTLTRPCPRLPGRRGPYEASPGGRGRDQCIAVRGRGKVIYI